MEVAGSNVEMEDQIAQWRSYFESGRAITPDDLDELESHLRDQVDALIDVGLQPDEAFLVAVKRLGNLDAVSREFAREHSERLWKQLVLSPASGQGNGDGDDGALAVDAGRARLDLYVMIGFALAAAAAIKVPALFGVNLDDDGANFYLRNFSLFAFPFVAGYFAWKRQLDIVAVRWLVALFVLGAVFANVYPFDPTILDDEIAHTEILTALHLPIALWFVVGFAYVGADWRSSQGRMDFIRFSGELAIYFTLISNGGGVLVGFAAGLFGAIGINIDTLLVEWLAPCGAVGAAVVAAWLVEAKQAVIENMAPVLTRIFTPLFTLLFLAFLVTMLVSGQAIDVAREILIAFDLALVLVLGLLLYTISARDPGKDPGLFDAIVLVLVLSALAIDVWVLGHIAARITEYGWSPNKMAALGENVILLANLAWSAVILIRIWLRKSRFAVLERWQTAYLPIYPLWAAFVVIAFPPIFGYR